MLNLYDYLTELDNKRIENYISAYGVQDGYIGNEEWLKYWRDNKKKLFHLLGGNLIRKYEFQYKKNYNQLEAELCGLRKHNFVSQYHALIDIYYRKFGIDYSTYNDLYAVVSVQNLANDSIIRTIKFKHPDKDNTLQLQAGMKPMRAAQKVLKYFDASDEVMASFEKFRIAHSMIFNEKNIKGTMCISIHPLDYMTMSDNASDWSSCMSWKEHGCYHAGTIEMMNSNNVLCCYLESKTPFVFGKDNGNEEEYTWNNKKWRQLVYFNKDIIVCGKSYPYANEEFSKFLLEKLRELAVENLNWTYTFGPEKYRDMIHVGSLHRMDNNRFWLRSKTSKKHNILFDTKGMYNDMFNDQNRDYWCIRNKVDSLKIISYSGKNNCLCCNKEIIEEDMDYDGYGYYEEGSYNNRYCRCGEVLCYNCADERNCYNCGNEHGYGTVYTIGGRQYCEKCIKDMIRICPDCGEPFQLAQYSDEVAGFRITDEYIYAKDARDTFSWVRYYDSSSNIVSNSIPPAKMKFIPAFLCNSCKETNELFECKTLYKGPAEPAWTSSVNGIYLSKFIYDENDKIISKYAIGNLKKVDIKNLN